MFIYFVSINFSLAADIVLFNSDFNRTSFLNNIHSFLNIQSDFKLRNIKEKIEPKCQVLYFPINFHKMPTRIHSHDDELERGLHLIWPHRWEHDKNPREFIDALLELNKRQRQFRVSIIGESFQTIPACFDGVQVQLGAKLINFGYLNRDEYFQCLLDGDIVISTADHEFYGVSM